MSIAFDKPILCPVLVGRDAYLEVLQQRLEEARKGYGKTFLIGGEAGVGKSRLVTETKLWARQFGVEILQGNCFEPDRILPYGPILDLLRECIAKDTTEEHKSLSPELFKLLPEFGARSLENTPRDSVDPAQEKKRYFQALDDFIKRDRGELLLIIEDIHWCDDTSLEFLLYFARKISTAPILLLLTYRDDEPNPSLVPFLAVLDHARLADELTLTRLSRHFRTSSADQKEFAEVIYSLTDYGPGAQIKLHVHIFEGSYFVVSERLQATVA